MSEKLGNSSYEGVGEGSGERQPSSPAESLSELAGGYDKEKAEQTIADKKRELGLSEADKPKENRVVEAGLLVAKPEKQEKELSPQEAANEYLSLLDELSQDFTNPQYAKKGLPTSQFVFIPKELGLKYSDNPHYRWSGYAGTEAGADDRTIYRMGMADYILENEIKWRGITDEESEKIKAIDENNRQVDEELAALEDEYSKKGRLGKFLGKRKYKESRISIDRSRQYYHGGKENDEIAKGLDYAYNENARDYSSYGDLSYLSKQSLAKNEVINRRFFGLDDPERMVKVERAIELRQKYADEWGKDA